LHTHYDTSPGDLKPGRRQTEVFLQKRLSDVLFIRDFITMLKTILLTMAIATILPGSGRNAIAEPLNISQFQWKNRLLFLFAPNRNHPLFEPLHKSLAARKSEAADRDLVVFEILESGPSSMNTEYLDTQAAQKLRDKFDVQRGRFAVILVGKDGGIKLNRQEHTPLKDIFALIDAMPMRREEMRQKSRSRESNRATPGATGVGEQ